MSRKRLTFWQRGLITEEFMQTAVYPVVLYWRAQWKVVSRLEKEFPNLYTDSSLPHLPLLLGTVAGSINTGEEILHPLHGQQSLPSSYTGGHGGR
jgi:hypothetical protein